MYSAEEVKDIIKLAHEVGAQRLTITDKSVGMDFYPKPQVKIQEIKAVKYVPPVPVDPTMGAPYTDEELFYSAKG